MIAPRTPAQINADHKAAVTRARLSGWHRHPIPAWVVTVLLAPGDHQDARVAARKEAA